MVASLRGRFLVLPLIALLFLALAVQAEPSRVVPAEEILKKIEMGQPVEYDNVTIVGDLKVGELNLPRINFDRTDKETYFLGITDEARLLGSPIKIEDSVILGSVSFNGTFLSKNISFKNTEFYGPVYSFGAHFNQNVNFMHAYFYQTTKFVYVRFNQTANFGTVQFKHTADFYEARFMQTAFFREAQFCRTADFFEAQFKRTASFVDAQFNQDAYFGNARFGQEAYFVNARFSQNAYFWDARFNQTVDFMDVQFNQIANFEEAWFNQTADFMVAQFNYIAYFRDARFNLTHFQEACFDQIADFEHAQFNQGAHFEDTKIHSVFFNNSQFSEDVFFDNAQINGTLSLYRTKYDKLNIRWPSIHDLAYDDTAYYLLIENFKKQGFTDDASECYYSYRYKHMWELLRLGKFDNWFFDLLAWATNGYGLRPVRPLGWSLLFILLGGAFFFVTKSISRSKGPEPSGNRLRAIREKELPQRAGEVSIWEAFLLSATYFTSGASSIISSVPEEFRPLGRSRYVVVILRLLGWIFFVLFLTSLGKIA